MATRLPLPSRVTAASGIYLPSASTPISHYIPASSSRLQRGLFAVVIAELADINTNAGFARSLN